jgi:hypothetical protein
VAPEHLEVAVLEGGDHRLRDPERAGFVPGYPEVVIEFINRVAGRGRTPDRGRRA